MANWNYLKFNKFGDPSKRNVNPPSNTFVWGFDLDDHQVKLCYQDDTGDGYLMIAEPGRLNDDCIIVAWAPIEEGKSAPDLERIKKCGNYWPPEGSLEYQRKLIRVLSHRKPKSAFEKRVNAERIAEARMVLANAKDHYAAAV